MNPFFEVRLEALQCSWEGSGIVLLGEDEGLWVSWEGGVGCYTVAFVCRKGNLRLQ